MGSGYMFCMHNEIYDYHGENVYRLDASSCPNKSMKEIDKLYLNDSELRLKSKMVDNCVVARNLLFMILDDYRIQKDNYFFACRLSVIAQAFERIEDLFRLRGNVRESAIADIEQEFAKKTLKQNN